jgi:hypothetical protein
MRVEGRVPQEKRAHSLLPATAAVIVVLFCFRSTWHIYTYVVENNFLLFFTST